MNNVDYDKKKYDRDGYGNLYPKKKKSKKFKSLESSRLCVYTTKENGE